MIEAAFFPRVNEKEELVLRIIGAESSTGVDVVEHADGRVSAGTIYETLGRLTERALLKREGRFYLLTLEGNALLRALDAAARVYREVLGR